MNSRKTFVLLITILISVNQSFAGKWRVNSNTDINADFSSLHTAINSSSVNAGDTLYCEGGSYFGDVSVDKHIVIIGPGYFLSQNDSTQAYTAASSIQNLTFKPGSDNSKIMGMKILGTLSIGNDSQYDTVSNITIMRNHIYQIRDNGRTYNYDASKFYNIKIINNYITYSVSFSQYTKTLFLKNNIILYTVSLSPVTADVINNTIIYDHYSNSAFSAKNCNINNNIIINPGTGAALSTQTYNLSENNNLSNNIISDATNANNPSNYYSATLAATVENSGSPDAKYQLKTGSPAIGYGTNGDDCGAFGGSQPYVLSGQPFLVPHIYEATIPGSVNKSNGLNIIIKAKAQNQ